MGLRLFGIQIFGSRAKQIIKDVAVSEVDRAVVALKNTIVGTLVANEVHAITAKDMTGAQKFEAVVESTLPLIHDFATRGGRAMLVHDVEDVARQLVQSVFNDVKSTKAGGIAQIILQLLGLF